MRLLRVARAQPLAEGIHAFEFRDPHGGTLPPFTAGAHVEVRAPNGSLRKYSLCNDPEDGDRYEIAVKRDPSGRGGSVSLVDGVRAGDEVEVSEPRNAFELNENAPGYLFIAGGIGITPLMSMLRRASALAKPFRMVYCTRTPAQTPFLDELAGDRFRGKVKLHHDGGDAARAFDFWPLLEKPSREHVYCCGPRPMLEAVRDMTGHWSAAAIHFESFIDAGASAKADDTAFEVMLNRSGARFSVPPGVSILEAMRAHGHEAPSSCESGTCGTCRTGLIAGRGDHRDLVLTDEERERYIMICVSRAATPTLVIDR